ncbi:MAG: HD domain-containing protein [Actinomycetota bacterium]|nr:HD domain-containing protein [Actinomycetota bacterium]
MKPLPAVRERFEELERASLSTWATLASQTKGRDRFEEPDRLRTAFQQDRDRVVHSEAFRQLKDKTQVVVATGDEAVPRCVRVRLTHTLEVVELARTVARGLRLNEDLVEAIALGHDLGHTPFGLAGEEALSAFTAGPFRHSEQSLRVVERLERGGRGLNLTWEVRDGILSHLPPSALPATPEGQVVRVADAVASPSHDLEAALCAGLVATEDLPGDAVSVLGRTHGERVTTMLEDVVAASLDSSEIAMSPPVREALGALDAFVAQAVHARPAADAERARAIHCLRSLCVFYLENESRLPAAHRGSEPLNVRVVDYVAAMTDREALEQFGRLFVPRPAP